METELLAFKQLLEVVAQLRSPEGGCPWDLAQTTESLIPYIIEESYEVVDAIKSHDQKAIASELGDLLLQVVLQAQIASEEPSADQRFTITEVCEQITQKLIRRHPHVFSNVNVESLDEIQHNWEQIKATETGEYELFQKLDRYARTLPPMMAAMKIIHKTKISEAYILNDIGASWKQFSQALAQGTSDQEPKDNQQSELGDLLFDIIAVAAQHQLDPFAALQSANHRFIDNLKEDDLEEST
jgi:XTP/dITP diphosphohydrolase